MSIPPPSIPPAGVPKGNGLYAVVAVLLIAGIVGLIVWKVAGSNEPETKTQPTASVDAVATAPVRNRLDDEIPPVEVDASVDAAPAKPATTGTALTGSGNWGCDAKRCSGSSTSDLESQLAMRAQLTRKRCFEPALSGDATLSGRVSVAVRIGPSGNVCSASVASNELANPQVAQCAAQLFRSTGGFPAPKGGCVDVTVPLNFVRR